MRTKTFSLAGHALIKLIGLGVILFFILSIQLSFAHISEWQPPQGGVHVEMGSYVFDFAHSPQVIDTKNITLLDFKVLDATSSSPIEYDMVWLKISSDEQVTYSDGITADKIVYSGQVKANNGDANFTFFFPKKGEYEISTLFYKDDQIIGEPKFTILVLGEKQIPVKLWVFIGAITLFTLVGMGIFMGKRRKSVDQKSLTNQTNFPARKRIVKLMLVILLGIGVVLYLSLVNSSIISDPFCVLD